MARRVPTSETHLNYPALSISLLAAWIAATIAIVAALCGDRSRKKPTSPPSESSSVNLTTKNLETGPDRDPETEKNEEAEAEGEPLPLPLPPIRRVNETTQPQMPRSASVAHHKGGGFLVSPSMNLGRSFSMAKAAKHHLPFTKEERMHGRKDKGRQSDSLWMKTIILGEKKIRLRMKKKKYTMKRGRRWRRTGRRDRDLCRFLGRILSSIQKQFRILDE